MHPTRLGWSLPFSAVLWQAENRRRKKCRGNDTGSSLRWWNHHGKKPSVLQSALCHAVLTGGMMSWKGPFALQGE